ncbi:MAG TPA: hypothetical protein PLV06_07480 [Bacteroidales bacterium]|nr:hypothetical protein [Bacteroidales bacterium]HPF02323.1 hypothetical protein [Bacteroidales bacterium]HPJ58955.1 hypothetical protein [Bacteroidales bacterium]HPR12209.1 hypothetical protein [Bacteroidales bacterium]HRW85857.1 hypothetical protein [Bacteroidales bacterium]
MKKAGLTLLITLLIFGSCTTGKKDSFQGTWQMIQMQKVEREKVTNYFSQNYRISQIKMWSGNHFMFVGKYQVDTTVVYRYGTGTYTINGNIYVEDIDYHFDKSYEGRKNKIWLEVRNDTLLHIFPVDDTGRPIQARHYIERYIRMN